MNAEPTYRPRFYGNNQAFIKINPKIIEQMGLTEQDEIVQELTSDGRIVLKRKETA
jgi:formylmethanofuran dehydrogenase subunit D